MTTAPPVTLADWLLAQIAEDEAALVGAGVCFNGDTSLWVVRARVECQAKRKILQQCLDVIASFGDWDAAEAKAAGGRVLWTDVNRRERSHAHATLDLLALPYADRDGYRDEWRP